MDANRNQLWAEAVHRVVQKKESIGLPRAAIAAQKEINENYRYNDESLENAIAAHFGTEGIMLPTPLEAIASEIGYLEKDGRGLQKTLQQHPRHKQERLKDALRNWARSHGHIMMNGRMSVDGKQGRFWWTE